jgi:hypothetical protein
VSRRLSDAEIRSTGGRGEESWASMRAIRRGVRLGLFCAFTVPALASLAWYFLHGGTVADLIPALIDEAVTLAGQVVGLIARLLGPLLPVAVIGGAAILVLGRRRSS